MNLLFLNIGTPEPILLALLLLFFVYTLYHAVTSVNLSSNQRLLWIAIILFGCLLGWIAYWVIGRNGDERAR